MKTKTKAKAKAVLPAWTVVAAAAASAAVTYALATRNSTQDSDHLERMRKIALNHEECLRKISDEGSPKKTLKEANEELSAIAARADACFHGRW